MAKRFVTFSATTPCTCAKCAPPRVAAPAPTPVAPPPSLAEALKKATHRGGLKK
jgi:hypothetical protein